MERVVDITDKYRVEILNIGERLNQLEKGLVYDLTGKKINGSLENHIRQLRDSIIDLIYKVEYNEKSIQDKMNEAAEKMNGIFTK